MSETIIEKLDLANGKDDCTCNVGGHSNDPREHDKYCAFVCMTEAKAEILHLLPVIEFQEAEEEFCTCGAGHGALEGHVDWCAWLRLAPLFEAFRDGNEMLRSAYQVAARCGAETNWDAYISKLEKTLDRQHRLMHGLTPVVR